MDPQIRQVALAILAGVPERIIRLYSEYALLLNAFDVTRRSYETRREVSLSTTMNVPELLRLPVEYDVVLDRDALVAAYGSELPLAFCRGFLVDVVAHLDAWMEDVFEQVLPIVRPGITPIEVERKVRSAWTDDNGMPAIRRVLLSEVALQTPQGRISTPGMVFDRYEEMREVRHAVMHADGRLTQRHVDRLSAIRARFPSNAPRGAGTMSDGLLPGGLVVGSEARIGANELLALRKWAFESVEYFRVSFTES